MSFPTSNTVLFQDTWKKSDPDLYAYLKMHGTKCKYADKRIIPEISDPFEFKMIICDSHLLESLFRMIDCFKPMNFRSYPARLESFIKRSIQQIRPKDLLDTERYPFPYWIKPSDDNPSFDARVVNSKELRDYVLRRIPDHNKPIYYCKKLDLVSEFRLFIADNKLHCIVDTTDYNRQFREGITDTNHILPDHETKSDFPSQQYIDEILSHNIYPYCVIDVAMSVDGVWYLIDVNPPFSVKRHGMPLSKYTEYCAMVWQAYRHYKQLQLILKQLKSTQISSN
jgi:hypothetical protein